MRLEFGNEKRQRALATLDMKQLTSRPGPQKTGFQFIISGVVTL